MCHYSNTRILRAMHNASTYNRPGKPVYREYSRCNHPRKDKCANKERDCQIRKNLKLELVKFIFH
nr:MAG TPA: hypothetical protein [Caudoviricetes sp.]